MASPLHHPKRLCVLLPRFWASRDQPIPGSFPKKDPGYEVVTVCAGELTNQN